MQANLALAALEGGDLHYRARHLTKVSTAAAQSTTATALLVSLHRAPLYLAAR